MLWTKKQPKILNEVYPDWLTNGIFKQLENFNVAWKEYVDGSVLDLDYHGNRSGEKIVSAVIDKLLVDDILSAEKQEKLASLIFYKYNQNWTRAWEAMIKEYDPLYNYNMRREEITDETLKIDNERTIEKTIEDTGTVNVARTGTESTVDSGTNRNTTSNQYSSETDNSIYGFNSDGASNADKSTTTQNNQSTSQDIISNNSTVTDDKNELTTKNLNTDDNTVDIEDNTHKKDSKTTVTQDGNIGVTTSQQMLESELQLRFNYNFFDLVFKDVDKILTAQIFRKKETY